MQFEALNGFELDPNAIAYFPFNGNVNDESNNGKDFSGGALVNGQFTDDPERGAVLEFEDNGILNIQSGTEGPDGLPTQWMTVAAWVRVDAPDEWGGFVGMIQDNGTDESGWILGTRFQRFSMAIASEDNGQLTYLQDSEDFELGRWYHLVATYDGSTLKLFVDGQLKSASSGQSGAIEYPATGWFQIGSYKDDNEDFGHDGGLDEVTIWGIAMSGSEVESYYNNVLVSVNEAPFIENKLTINASPNPSDSVFYIAVKNNNHSRLLFNISNSSGKIVFRKKIKVKGGKIELDAGDFPKGIYFLTVSDHHETATIKLAVE